MKWISVKERLPEPSSTDKYNRENLISDTVLVYEKSEIRLGHYNKKIDHWSVQGRIGCIEVTHWLPLEIPVML